MFTWGPKYLFGISISALIGAIVYGLVTGGDIIGVLSSGYKGAVGDHTGYVILLGVFLTTQVLTWILVAVRDGDVEALADRVGADTPPVVAPPADASPWGLMVALGLAFIVLGAAASAFFYLGLAIALVGALQWLLLAWSDRATGDLETNRAIRHRVADPFEVPILSTLGIAAVVVCASRIFLTTSKTGSVVAGTILTVLVFGGAVLFSQGILKSTMTRGLMALGGLLLLAGGIVGGVRGERDFEHHGDETHEESNHDDAESHDEDEPGDQPADDTEGEGE
mgnify:CR=1 FL=1